MTQRWQAWGRWAAVIFAAALAVAVAFVSFCLFTPPGHAVVSRLITPLTGGSVTVSGLSGSLPNHFEAREIELRDTQGPWLRAEGVHLDWHALALIDDHFDVEAVQADRVVVLRREVRKPSTGTSTTRVDVNSLRIGRIELAPAVLGHGAVLMASGSLHYASRDDMAADLAIRRLDAEGRYDVHAGIANGVVRGTIAAREGGAGLAGGLIGMPDLGPVVLDAHADARGTQSAIAFKLSAGRLEVSGAGRIDIKVRRANVDFSASSGAMHPNAWLSWSSLSATGHIRGALDGPDIDAALDLGDLGVKGARAARVQGRLTGIGGIADLKVTAVDLRIPGSKPALLASAPVVLTAHVDMLAQRRPVRFAIDHPLVKLAGELATRGHIAGNATLEAPSLGAIMGASLDGAAHLSIKLAQGDAGTSLWLNGRIAARGHGALARLIGAKAELATRGTLRDARNAVVSASFMGAAVRAKLGGQIVDGTEDFEGELALSDLAPAMANLIGSLSLHWRLEGPMENGALNMTGAALVATKGMAKQQVAIVVRASGLPKLKTANVRLAGSFDSSPLKVSADIAPSGTNAVKISLVDSSWRSAGATGSVALEGAQPSGSIVFRIARLGDLSPLIGISLAGSLDARADFKASAAAIHASARNVSLGTTQISRLDVNGNVGDPLGKPVLDLAVSAAQFAASGVSGSANARIDGPLQNLTVKLSAGLSTGAGRNFTVAADLAVDAVERHAVIGRFDGVWRDQTVTLASPASLDFRGGEFAFSAILVDGKAARLSLGGTIPVGSGQPMNVKASGTADLGVLMSGLAAVGQSVRGKVAMNAIVKGTMAKPQVEGSATVTGGQFGDFETGVNLTNIAATAEAQGGTIRLTQFTAKAGSGTITGTGTVDLSAPGTPVDIGFKAVDARPVTSDLITATMNGDLKLEGTLSERLMLTGKLDIRHASINLAEKLPSNVAKLDVRRSDQPSSPPSPAPLARVGLDLAVSSPGQVFVRGRGLDAEFEGNLKVSGTSDRPQVIGALNMRRGTFSLAGANLTFQSGKIGFVGGTVGHELDPTLDFVAQSQTGGVTATLKVTGTARQPKIELTSSPQMPQDEILAQLLFQQSAKSLSAMQLASVAQAAASLGGGGVGFDPVGTIRKSLGLDRLALGSTQPTNGSKGSTTVEAGKYILRNVYVAARQDISGGTRAQVQVDLTKHLKAQAAVTTGPRAAASTPLQDNGDSIGLSYEFEY